MGINLNSTSGRLLASAALVAAAASVAGRGTYGAFTSQLYPAPALLVIALLTPIWPTTPGPAVAPADLFRCRDDQP